LFTVKGSSALYEVKIVDFVEVEDKESELVCNECFVICCEFPRGFYSFTPNSGCKETGKETPGLFIICGKGVGGVDWDVRLFFFCKS